MFEKLKKLIAKLDEANKRFTTKCDYCGHEMQGSPLQCERCGAELTGSRE